MIRELANGREVELQGLDLRFPWGHRRASSRCGSPAYGPKALALAGEVGDGFILQLADPDITAWSITAVRDAAERAGRDPDSITICVAAPAYVGDDLPHMRDQCRWFGGMVGNHVADIVARYGDSGGAVPQALTDYIKGRQGYDYNEHGRSGNTHTELRARRDRRPLLHPRPDRAAHRPAGGAEGARRRPVRRSTCSTTARSSTLEAYGENVIPAVAETVAAKQ